MEVPRLGVELELHLPAYSIAMATLDLNLICTLHSSLRHRQSLNPLSEARDQTCILMDTSQVHYHWATSLLFRAAPLAYGSSQARGQIRAVVTSLHHSHSNTGSLTWWAKLGIEPASSWMLVRFVNQWATTGIPEMLLLKKKKLIAFIFRTVLEI